MSLKIQLPTVALSLIAVISVFGSHSLKAGAPVYVGVRSAASVSIDKIDHTVWDALLKRYVDKDGMVDYRGFHANAADKAKLNAYLNHLSTANADVAATREAKLAFWINAYNAVTVHGILQKYPTTSIRNHTAKVVGYNIWHDLQLMVGGKPFSLDSMEHKILRKMSEPRIHFAIVCASKGCPRLLNEAFVASKMEQQLEVNTKDFFSRPHNFKHDPNSNKLYLSAIMDWFGGDFGATKAQQLARIAPWLPASSQQAARTAGTKVAFLDYDWGLNAQR